jgi:propanediol dehydratase small subunit
MTGSRLTEELEAALAIGHSLRQIVEALRGYRSAGISREEVLQALECLRSQAQDEAQEDRILEVMDIVSGFCSAENSVWEDPS